MEEARLGAATSCAFRTCGRFDYSGCPWTGRPFSAYPWRSARRCGMLLRAALREGEHGSVGHGRQK